MRTRSAPAARSPVGGRRALLAAALCAISLTAACKRDVETGADTSSLTGPDYKGTKRYFGFAEPLSGMQGNEVRFDVRHTHDVFAAEQGGKYVGATATRRDDVTLGKIRAALDGYVRDLGPDDMYVQYSAGHGLTDRLGVGLTYDEMRDRILQMKAKEIVVFTMACYSGTLVDSFNRKKEAWEGWKDAGRTLFVMSSSGATQLSATGPGTDAAEPFDARGSAGSRFGFALWKGLRGAADGYGARGGKDDLITLGELADFVTDEVKKHEKNQHTPVITGVFDPGLVMARPAPALPPNPRWAEARDRLRPKIDELKAKVEATKAAMKRIEEDLAALRPTPSAPVAAVTPPETTARLAALADAETALATAAARRLDSVVARADLLAAAWVESDATMATYAAESYADEEPDAAALEAELDAALARADAALGALGVYATGTGATVAESTGTGGSGAAGGPSDVEERRRLLLARHRELLSEQTRLTAELKELEAALQRVVDELSGFL